MIGDIGGRARAAARTGAPATEASPSPVIREDSSISPPLYRRVLVVFAGRSGVWWLRWLHPGFRHCFAALDDGAQWLTVDPLLHRLEVRASGLPSAFDLAAEYRRMKLTVLEIAPPAIALRRAPLGVFTCVETVKRLLGLRAPLILTPHQLHRLLSRGIAAGGFTGSEPSLEQNKKIILTRA